MASRFTELETNYTNDVLDTDLNGNIIYELTHLSDSTTESISLTDVTVYDTLGDSLDAGVINATNGVVNAIGTALTDAESEVDDLQEGLITLDTTQSAGTVDGDLYLAITALGWESDVIV